MTTLQWVLGALVWLPASAFVASIVSDTGYSRFRVTIDWGIFTLVFVWFQLMAAFVLSLAGAL